MMRARSGDARSADARARSGDARAPEMRARTAPEMRARTYTHGARARASSGARGARDRVVQLRSSWSPVQRELVSGPGRYTGRAARTHRGRGPWPTLAAASCLSSVCVGLRIWSTTFRHISQTTRFHLGEVMVWCSADWSLVSRVTLRYRDRPR